jgi:hypothetical protein
MSQYNFEDATGDRFVQFGFDHAVGYFIAVYDETQEPIVSEDSLFNGLTGVGLVEQLDEYEPPEELQDMASGVVYYWLDLRTRAMLDLPI